MTALSCPKISQAVYRPRRPEKTPLFQVIKKNYLPWCKKRENQENPVPHYINNVFQKYLGCGILAKGFACAHCDGCRPATSWLRKWRPRMAKSAPDDYWNARGH